jgi:hypothetical protein
MYTRDFVDIFCENSSTSSLYLIFLNSQDLALGVADLHTPDAVSAAEKLIGGQACVTETSAGSGLDSEHSDTDEEDEKTILQSTWTKRPKIEALS